MTTFQFKDWVNISIFAKGNNTHINFRTADMWAKMLFKNTSRRTIRKMNEEGV